LAPEDNIKKFCKQIQQHRDLYYQVMKFGRNDGIYGDAGWAYKWEIYKAGLLQTDGENDAESGIFLGVYLEAYGMEKTDNIWDGTFTGRQLIYSGDSNAITTAPPRGGKNATEIIPTLLLNRVLCLM
jgi:type IV secretory pathway TraG/TraD family ATPase VirD4